MKKSRLKDRLLDVIIIVLLVVGVSLILYPLLSNYISSLNQSKTISNYLDIVNKDDDLNDELLKEAQTYNEKLYEDNRNITNADANDEYDDLLKFSNTDIMSIITIPKIDLVLPVYHGTSEGVLQRGIGHIEGSSLPIGGENTHTVLMGHRGLPSSKLFTSLDKLAKGDIIYLKTANLDLVYEVDDVKVVEPDALSSLKIYDDKDYLTLITCTPYGINTHRLLIGAHRKQFNDAELNAAKKDNPKKISKNVQRKNLITLMVVIIIILLLLLITFFFYNKNIKYHRKKDKKKIQ